MSFWLRVHVGCPAQRKVVNTYFQKVPRKGALTFTAWNYVYCLCVSSHLALDQSSVQRKCQQILCRPLSNTHLHLHH